MEELVKGDRSGILPPRAPQATAQGVKLRDCRIFGRQTSAPVSAAAAKGSKNKEIKIRNDIIFIDR